MPNAHIIISSGKFEDWGGECLAITDHISSYFAEETWKYDLIYQKKNLKPKLVGDLSSGSTTAKLFQATVKKQDQNSFQIERVLIYTSVKKIPIRMFLICEGAESSTANVTNMTRVSL